MKTHVRLIHAVGLLLLVAAVVPFVIVTVPQSVGADHSYVVTSGSMSPAIPAGSQVFVTEVPPHTITDGDVITFETGASGAAADGDRRVTHRVVDVVEKDGQRYFRTQGDANDAPDSRLVPAGNVIGTVVFHVPYLGYGISMAGSDAGLVTLVIVPAVLLVVTELWSLAAAFRADATPPDTERPQDSVNNSRQ